MEKYWDQIVVLENMANGTKNGCLEALPRLLGSMAPYRAPMATSIMDLQVCQKYGTKYNASLRRINVLARLFNFLSNSI